MTGTQSYSSRLYAKIRQRVRHGAVFAEIAGSELTYRQLLHAVRTLATFFRDSGLHKGDRLVICTRHDRHATLLFIAALLEGLTPAMLSAETKSERIRAIVTKLHPAMIFADTELIVSNTWLQAHRCVPIENSPGQQAEDSLPLLQRGHAAEAAPVFPALMDRFPETDPACSAAADDIAYIIFTSGTTSAPKGILITHENLFEHLETIIRIFSYTADCRIFNNMALAHADGLVQGPLLALASGASLFRPSGFTIQNLEPLLDTIASRRISHFITVPTILSLIDRLLSRDDYFSGGEFAAVVSVAAKIDPHLWQRLQDRFGIRICNIYGLSETVSGGIFCGPADGTFAIGTVGKPVDMEAQIVNEEGRVCSPGETGELWLKGRNVTPGYLDDSEANAGLFAGDWLRSGDLATLDQHGFIRIAGRKKAVIVSGGFNIQPDEVTEVLLRHPSIVDAATVGIDDADWGELVASAVEADVLIDSADVTSHCRRYLENHKVPKKIIQVRKLPRGISGKVKIPEIRSMLADHSRGNAGDQAMVLDELIALASTVFDTPCSQLDPDLPPAEIPGWDSLGHLSLVAAVEKKYGVAFSLDDMMRIDSLRCLCTILTSLLSGDIPSTPDPGAGCSWLPDNEYEIMLRVVHNSRIGEKHRGSLMLGMHTRARRPPLFWCFNAFEAEYSSLAAHLGPTQPLFCLYSGAGVLNKAISPDRLAEHYVNEILARNPIGPIAIGGNCRGGRIAWKMVQLLEAMEIEVERVCLLEYFSPAVLQGSRGRLLLLFGERSPLRLPEQFRWPHAGWQDQFVKVPQVVLTPGSHGNFFQSPNIEPLSDTIKRFLGS